MAWRVKKAMLTLSINLAYLAYIRYSLSECGQKTLTLLSKLLLTHQNRLSFDLAGVGFDYLPFLPVDADFKLGKNGS